MDFKNGTDLPKSKMISNKSNQAKEIEKIYIQTMAKIKRKKWEIPLLLIVMYSVLGVIVGLIINPTITIIVTILLIAISYGTYRLFMNKKE